MSSSSNLLKLASQQRYDAQNLVHKTTINPFSRYTQRDWFNHNIASAATLYSPHILKKYMSFVNRAIIINRFEWNPLGPLQKVSGFPSFETVIICRRE